jgi:uncharacterized repeat protein (TIGR03803 family)
MGTPRFLATHPIATLPALATVLTLASLLVVFAAPTVSAQNFTVIHSFTGGSDGYQPVGGLTVDRGNNLYGTTPVASTGPGTVFRLVRNNGSWILSTLYNFHTTDGSTPQGRVVFGTDGALYGTTSYGGSQGYGTVYRLRPPATACRATSCPWSEDVLHSFQGNGDGIGPFYVDPVFDSAGNLYGTTVEGGTGPFGAGGVVFKLAPSGGGWTESVIYSFTGTDHPYAGVVVDTAGNLYGTTTDGGRYLYGNVFEVSPSGSGWAARSLYDFQDQSDGAVPYGGLLLDPSGILYGATGASPYGGGTVYTLLPSGENWVFGLVYGLYDSGAGGPLGNLVEDAAGNIYGTTYTGGANNFGVVFKLKPVNGGWMYTTLHDFTDGEDGGIPIAGPTIDANGNLYGTTTSGGIRGGSCPEFGCGVIWEITP